MPPGPVLIRSGSGAKDRERFELSSSESYVSLDLVLMRGWLHSLRAGAPSGLVLL